VIQRNAIQSWKSCVPDAQIILFGSDEGVAKVDAELAVMHVASVRHSANGAPLMTSVFDQAHTLTKADILCFANTEVRESLPDSSKTLICCARNKLGAFWFTGPIPVKQIWSCSAPMKLAKGLDARHGAKTPTKREQASRASSP
jgi:hypothetical protein